MRSKMHPEPLTAGHLASALTEADITCLAHTFVEVLQDGELLGESSFPCLIDAAVHDYHQVELTQEGQSKVLDIRWDGTFQFTYYIG